MYRTQDGFGYATTAGHGFRPGDEVTYGGIGGKEPANPIRGVLVSTGFMDAIDPHKQPPEDIYILTESGNSVWVGLSAYSYWAFRTGDVS